MDFYKKGNTLHHAYCILGNISDVVDDIQIFLKKELDFSLVNNPDYWYAKYDVLDIDDARELKELHQNKPIQNERKIFVVTTNFITEKAQNAMLKMFEEPVGSTHFFLLMPSADGLIPTLKSRLIIIAHTPNTHTQDFARDFFTLSYGARLEEIKKLTNQISDEEKSKVEAVTLINALEAELLNSLPVSQDPALFEIIEHIRQYAQDPSPSLKMLLEYLAIILPVQEK